MRITIPPIVTRLPWRGCCAILLLLSLASIGWSASASQARPATPPLTPGPPQAALTLAPTTHQAPARPALVLYDQYDNFGPNLISSQNFEPAQDAYDAQAADDFTIPGGQTWTVDQVEVAGGYYNGAGPATSVNVVFYTDAGTLPGTPVFTQTGIIPSAGLSTGDFVLPLNPPALLPTGTYWVSVQANQDLTPNGQWYWRNRYATNNHRAAWRNPGGGFGRINCTNTWGERAYGCWISWNDPDQAFRLDGASNASPTPTTTGTPPTAVPTPTRAPTITGTPPLPPPILTQPASFTPGPPPPSATPLPVCAPVWQVVNSPNVNPDYHTLQAVGVLAPDDAWAVGGFPENGRVHTLTEHWDGSTWTIISSPNAGFGNNHLNAVAAAAPDDVWAVGSAPGSSTEQTLTLHWNGLAWSIVPSPNVGGTPSLLYGVAVVNGHDVWAVGYSYNSSMYQTLIMHWDGASWTIVTSPNRPGLTNQLYSVTALAPNDVWAVGSASTNNFTPQQTLVVHWDGTQWSLVTSPNGTGVTNRLVAVAAASANDIWAVGSTADLTGPQFTLTLHWNGSAWTLVASPDVGQNDNRLLGVAAPAPGVAWAVGTYGDGNRVSRTLVERWNGTNWDVYPSSNAGPLDNQLNGVAALDADTAWAVGYGFNGNAWRTLIERLRDVCATPSATPTGTPPTATPTRTPLPTLTPDCRVGWHIVSSPAAGISFLRGVAPVSASDVWAVGYRSTGANMSQTLIDHWDGTAWSTVSSPNGGSGENYLYAVTARAAQDVWAVGSYTNGLGTPTQTLILHWDGTGWQVVPAPSPGTTSSLLGVTAQAANDAWAVGQWYNSGFLTLTLHWNGTSWSQVASPSPNTQFSSLTGVSALGPADVWAVGYAFGPPGSGNVSVTLHWDGTQWSVVPSPGSQLSSVAAIAPDDVWAVGIGAQNGGPLLLHWDGTTWTPVNGPTPTQSLHIASVAARTATDVWAAGDYVDPSGTSVTLILHWDGTVWTTSPSANVLNNDNELYGIAPSAPGEVWAVGNTFDHTTSYRTLIERYGNPCLTPLPTNTPLPTSTPSPTRTPSPTATHEPTATPCPITFTDVPVGSTFYDYIRCLACRGIISGYPCGGPNEPCPGQYYRPNNNVTRGQVAKIVADSAHFSEPVPSSQQTFADVAPGSTFALWVERLAGRGIIGGYPCGGPFEPCVAPANRPYFRPNNNVTRGQLSKITSGAAGWTETPTGQTFQDAPPVSTFYLFIERMAARGIITGYPCGGAGEPCVAPGNRPYFRPNANATRGQMSKIAASAFFPNCQTPAQR